MTDKMMKALAGPFSPTAISWRPGSMTKEKPHPKKAMALAYIDARDVMVRLDEACGWDGWQRLHAENGICKLGVYSDERADWVWKTDVSGDTAIEAEKGSASRSFCRAAANFGIGRYLYDLPSPWMPINEYKRFTPESLASLTDRLAKWQATYFKS